MVYLYSVQLLKVLCYFEKARDLKVDFMLFFILRYKNAIKIQLVSKSKVGNLRLLKRNVLVTMNGLKMRDLFKQYASW
jgi:hypothetical protein